MCSVPVLSRVRGFLAWGCLLLERPAWAPELGIRKGVCPGKSYTWTLCSRKPIGCIQYKLPLYEGEDPGTFLTCK